MAHNAEILSRKERDGNARDILNALNPNHHNLNTMMLGFTDIMQSTFYNHLKSLCRSSQEVAELNTKIEKVIEQVISLLNEGNATPAEDMVVLTTAMAEVINQTLTKQSQSELAVDRRAVIPKEESAPPVQPKPQNLGARRIPRHL